MTTKTVLITGSSSGFGKLAVKTFNANGWNVIATMRSPEKETELQELDNVMVTRLDVIDTDSIAKAVEQGIARFGGIDVLVNNAGYGGYGMFEQVSDEAIRAMYETNVFGVMNVSRVVLPHMRSRKSGRIINVTSMAGIMSAPTISIYSSSKHAVQGLTEGMAYEYKPLGILVKSILPGSYPTTRFNANTDDELTAGGNELATHAKRYYDHIQGIAEAMATQGGKEADPQEVADRIFACATTDTPVHNPVGSDAEMLAGMLSPKPRQEFVEQMEQMLLPQ